MLNQLQMLLIRWILQPIYRVKKTVPEKVWSVVATLTVAGMIMLQIGYLSGAITRYLVLCIPFCLCMGLLILAGLSEDMKPLNFSPVLVVCWFGVAAFILVTGVLVERTCLAEAMVWLLVFPVFFVVWGNREFSQLARIVTNGVYVAFGVVLFVCMNSYPIKGVKYIAFMMNQNSLAMYASAVSVVAVVDIFSQKKFGLRMVLADLILGMSSSISYCTASRAGQAALLISGVACALMFLVSRKEKLRKAVLAYILPAVLALVILMPNGGVLINGGNSIMKDMGIANLFREVPTGTQTGSAPAADQNTWDAIQKLNEDRMTQGVGEGFDAFSTGRVDLWKIYLREVRFLGNPSSKQLTNESGKVLTKSAHCTLIQMAYEYGALSAVFFLVLNLVSGIKAIVYAYKKRAFDYSLFPVTVALAYGAYYMVEKLLYPAVSMLMLLYLISQTPLIARRDVQSAEN